MWDHVVNEHISKLQILKPEKLRKNEVMQEMFHASAMVPGNKSIENPMISVFKPLKTLSCGISLWFLIKSKRDLYSSWEHHSHLIFFWKSQSCFSPTVILKIIEQQDNYSLNAIAWKSGTPDAELKLFNQILGDLHIF